MYKRHFEETALAMRNQMILIWRNEGVVGTSISKHSCYKRVKRVFKRDGSSCVKNEKRKLESSSSKFKSCLAANLCTSGQSLCQGDVVPSYFVVGKEPFNHPTSTYLPPRMRAPVISAVPQKGSSDRKPSSGQSNYNGSRGGSEMMWL